MGLIASATQPLTKGVLRLPLGTRAQLYILQKIPRRHRWLWVHQINRVIRLPVTSISHFCLFDTREHSEFVLSGDWDTSKLPIQPELLRNPHYSCVFEMLVEGRHYSDTAHYRQIMAELSSAGVSEKRMGRRIHSVEAADQYFLQLTKILREIRKNGYRSQSELGGNLGNEVGITIDRDGNPLKYHNGHHRFAAAQILNIKSIPVCVQYVHFRTFSRWACMYAGNVIEVINQGLDALEAGHSV